MLEVVTPKGTEDLLKKVTGAHPITTILSNALEDNLMLHRILLPTELTETLTDQLVHQFSGYSGFRIIVLSVDATLPKPEKVKEDEKNASVTVDKNSTKEKNKVKKLPNRISREELYNQVSTGNEISWVFLTMVFLSSLVAAIGLLRNDVAVIVGAMVIAPLLKPNIALALADVLDDWTLTKKSLATNAVGFLLALSVAFLLGYLVDPSPAVPEIASRTHVSITHVILALAAGSAGALAFTTGAPAALVGVMVAVALMPPLATLGLMLGSGHLEEATGSLVLFLANMASVNLSALLTFKLQGIKPRDWWQHRTAQKRMRVTLTFWSIFLVTLSVIIFLKWQYPEAVLDNMFE